MNTISATATPTAAVQSPIAEQSVSSCVKFALRRSLSAGERQEQSDAFSFSYVMRETPEGWTCIRARTTAGFPLARYQALRRLRAACHALDLHLSNADSVALPDGSWLQMHESSRSPGAYCIRRIDQQD